MQQPRRTSFLVLLVGLIITGPLIEDALGQASPAGPARVRSQQLRALLDSIEGTAQTKPRVFRPRGGYVSFILAPPSTHFPVDPTARTTPERAATQFLQDYRNLFVSNSPAVGFDVIRTTDKNARTYVRYRQIYGGLEVFAAQVIVKVNAARGIVAASSDIMVDTTALDQGLVSLSPTVQAGEAQSKAAEFLAARHSWPGLFPAKIVVEKRCPNSYNISRRQDGRLSRRKRDEPS